MLHDIKRLLEEMEAKVGETAGNLLTEDEKIVHVLAKHGLCANLSGVHKLWDCLQRKEKLGSVENQWGNNLLFILIIPTFASWKKKCYVLWQLLFCLLKY